MRQVTWWLTRRGYERVLEKSVTDGEIDHLSLCLWSKKQIQSITAKHRAGAEEITEEKFPRDQQTKGPIVENSLINSLSGLNNS